MENFENLRAGLREIKISLDFLSKVTREELERLPDQGGWHAAADVLEAVVRLQEAASTVKGEDYDES